MIRYYMWYYITFENSHNDNNLTNEIFKKLMSSKIGCDSDPFYAKMNVDGLIYAVDSFAMYVFDRKMEKISSMYPSTKINIDITLKAPDQDNKMVLEHGQMAMIDVGTKGLTL